MRDYSELGQVIDKVLAKKWGITKTAVTQHRLKRGIAPYRTHCKVRVQGMKERSDEFMSMLGKQSDASIGKEFNLSRERVRQVRNNCGIAKYRKKGEKMTKPQIVAVVKCLLEGEGEMLCRTCMFRETCNTLKSVIEEILDKQ